jgi:hypothetical protein
MWAQLELPYCAATILPAASRPALLASAPLEVSATDGAPEVDGGQDLLLTDRCDPALAIKAPRSGGIDARSRTLTRAMGNRSDAATSTRADAGDSSGACSAGPAEISSEGGPGRVTSQVVADCPSAHRTIKKQIIHGSTPKPAGGVIIAAEIRIHGVFITRPMKREMGTDATTDMAIEGPVR